MTEKPWVSKSGLYTGVIIGVAPKQSLVLDSVSKGLLAKENLERIRRDV